MSNSETKQRREILDAQYHHYREQYKSEVAHHHTYTAIIVFGSYGALITALWGLRGIVSVETTAWSALLLLGSMVSFISHELYRVWWDGNNVFDMSNALGQPTIEDFHEKITAFEREKAAKYSIYKPWWRRAFIGAAGGGIGAALVMAFGLVGKFGWAFWTKAWWISALGA